MARHVLIVEKSQMTRRVLQARILAILDDVILSEAANLAEAEGLLEKSTIHLVLYGWEAGDEEGIAFCRDQLSNENVEIPFVFLVNDKKSDVEELQGHGVESFVRMPCAADELAAVMDQSCHPSSLRETKRYVLAGSYGALEQRQLALQCKVLNVSLGGILCEFEMDARFNCIDPFMISANLSDSEQVKIKDIYSIVSNFKVVKRNSDHTPQLVRMGVKFLHIPDNALESLKKILDRAELEEEAADQ